MMTPIRWVRFLSERISQIGRLICVIGFEGELFSANPLNPTMVIEEV